MSDETDLDVISEAMEQFIQTFKDELIPASIQIVDRLVRSRFTAYQCFFSDISLLASCSQCQNYLRLMDEHIALEAKASTDLSISATMGENEDKVMAMMGIAKTIETVSVFFRTLCEALEPGL